MPNKGAKVYNIWGGQLRIARFVEESILPGCSLPTSLVREGRQHIRCSTTMWLDTASAAWERYLKQCEAAIPAIEKHLEDTKNNLAQAHAEVLRVKAILETA